MRLLPIVPILLSIAALILGFLCLFAGSKPSFLENYSILTLNTSRIGQNVLNTTSSSSSSSTLGSLFHNLTDPLVNDLKGDINKLVGSVAQELGLEDFYSIHIMDYCHGDFTPQAVPNATVHDIHKNVTGCSNRTAMFTFDPREALERSLNQTGNKVGTTASKLLDQIDWPEDIDKGIRTLRTAFKAQFVIYCIALGFTTLTILVALFWVFSQGRLGALSVSGLAFSAFLFMGIASAIATAIAVKGAKVFNKYGKEIGVSANRGNGFMGMTWAATGCLLIASIVGCVGCFGAHRKRKNGVKPYNGEKP